MGTYYYLLNDTKKHRVSLGAHVKEGPLRHNAAVHFAFVNYMMDNQGDALRMVSDVGTNDMWYYTEINLMNYEFSDGEVIQKVTKMLDEIYGHGGWRQ